MRARFASQFLHDYCFVVGFSDRETRVVIPGTPPKWKVLLWKYWTGRMVPDDVEIVGG